MILIRALVWATMFVAFGLVFLPARILARAGITAPARIGALEIAAMGMVACGALLVVASLLAFVFVGKGTPAPFDPPRRLVIAGPFRYVRNPIYIGALLAMLGAALLYRSSDLLLYALGLAAVFHLLVIFYEEPVLRRQFGPEYEAYLARVNRWIPGAG